MEHGEIGLDASENRYGPPPFLPQGVDLALTTDAMPTAASYCIYAETCHCLIVTQFGYGFFWGSPAVQQSGGCRSAKLEWH